MRLKKALCIAMMVSGYAQALTLEDAVQKSIITNPDVLFNRAKTLSDRQGIDVAAGAYLPSVDVRAGVGEEATLNPTTSALQGGGVRKLTRKESSVELTQSLFAGGAIIGEYHRNQYLYQAQLLKTQGIAEDLALDATKRYLDVLLNEQLLGLAVNNLKAHKKVFALIKERSDAGLSREAELDQADSRLALAEANKISAEANLREARITFARVIGAWPEKLQWPKEPSIAEMPKTLNQAIEVGAERHPTVKSSYADIKEAKEQYKVARSRYYPSVDFVLRASENRNLAGLTGPNNDKLAIIRMNYNIFRGGADQAEVRRTAYQVQEAYEEKNKALLDLRESLRLSWNAWISSSERLSPLRRHVKAAKKTRSAYQEQFKLGKRTLLDLLDSQNEYYQASIENARGYVDEVYSRYRIINGVGKLIIFFNVRIPTNVVNGDIFNSAQRQVVTEQPMDGVPMPEMLEEDLRIAKPVKQVEKTPLTKPNLLKNSHIPYPARNRDWFVQVGKFSSLNFAKNMVDTLRAKGFKVFAKEIDRCYFVFAGPYEYRGLAANTMERLKSIAHVEGLLVTFRHDFKDKRIVTYYAKKK
ncbi:TolC family outer membrane protein [Legionella sp. W05-934-2]|uniref:TolC family outer membrane protein n=1 Tax=Legionella sp. W05-934-2 TaxID=1198649 RepID=UPI003462F700